MFLHVTAPGMIKCLYNAYIMLQKAPPLNKKKKPIITVNIHLLWTLTSSTHSFQCHHMDHPQQCVKFFELSVVLRLDQRDNQRQRSPVTNVVKTNSHEVGKGEESNMTARTTRRWRTPSTDDISDDWASVDRNQVWLPQVNRKQKVSAKAHSLLSLCVVPCWWFRARCIKCD